MLNNKEIQDHSSAQDFFHEDNFRVDFFQRRKFCHSVDFFIVKFERIA